MKSIAVLILVLSIAGLVFSGSCPPANHLKSCTCTGDKVSCFNYNNNIQLKSDFEAIMHGRSENYFAFFELSSNNIEYLEENVFQGVTFGELKFEGCAKLSCVDRRAFDGLQKTTRRILSRNSNFSIINSTCNIFNAMSSLLYLELINITASEIKEVPSNAFQGRGGLLDRLYWVNLSGGNGGSMTTISESAFSDLKNLRYVDLSYHKITSIKRNAFVFNEPSDNQLYINLERNYDSQTRVGLNGNSFEGAVFQTGNRRTSLNLGKNPELKWLSEDTFMSFLSNKPGFKNKINMDGTTLGYYYQNKWLVKMRETLNLIDKIPNLKTDDEEDFYKESIEKFSNTPTPPPTLAATGSPTPTTINTTTV